MHESSLFTHDRVEQEILHTRGSLHHSILWQEIGPVATFGYFSIILRFMASTTSSGPRRPATVGPKGSWLCGQAVGEKVLPRS